MRALDGSLSTPQLAEVIANGRRVVASALIGASHNGGFSESVRFIQLVLQGLH